MSYKVVVRVYLVHSLLDVLRFISLCSDESVNSYRSQSVFRYTNTAERKTYGSELAMHRIEGKEITSQTK